VWIYTSNPLHVLIACFLIMHRDRFKSRIHVWYMMFAVLAQNQDYGLLNTYRMLRVTLPSIPMSTNYLQLQDTVG
jgi:hypothetical protein